MSTDHEPGPTAAVCGCEQREAASRETDDKQLQEPVRNTCHVVTAPEPETKLSEGESTAGRAALCPTSAEGPLGPQIRRWSKDSGGSRGVKWRPREWAEAQGSTSDGLSFLEKQGQHI